MPFLQAHITPAKIHKAASRIETGCPHTRCAPTAVGAALPTVLPNSGLSNSIARQVGPCHCSAQNSYKILCLSMSFQGGLQALFYQVSYSQISPMILPLILFQQNQPSAIPQMLQTHSHLRGFVLVVLLGCKELSTNI